MSHRQRAGVVVRSCLAAALLLAQNPAWLRACAVVPHEGDTVRVADETALILWDAKAKTEHFIRRANFRTTAKDFGLLVPTPTRPELGEVGDDLFGKADLLTRPRVIYQTVIRRMLRFGIDSPPPAAKEASSAAAPGGKVEVLHQQTVAGFDAANLKADDPKALADWLKDHGYDARPELAEWPTRNTKGRSASRPRGT